MGFEQRALVQAAEQARAALFAELGEELNGKQIRRAVEAVLANAMVPIKAIAARDIAEALEPVVQSLHSQAAQQPAYGAAADMVDRLAEEIEKSASEALRASETAFREVLGER